MSTTINLRDYYYWYTQDEFVEVSDEVAAELQADRRYEKTHERISRRNKVYSLTRRTVRKKWRRLLATATIQKRSMQ